jgi:hypothetical protein
MRCPYIEGIAAERLMRAPGRDVYRFWAVGEIKGITA